MNLNINKITDTRRSIKINMFVYFGSLFINEKESVKA